MQIKAIEIQIIDIEFIPILRKALKSTKAQLLKCLLPSPGTHEIAWQKVARAHCTLLAQRSAPDRAWHRLLCLDSGHANALGHS